MIHGERILERLSAIGKSQSWLARRLKLHQSTVNGLVHGEQRSSTKLHEMARELLTSPAYLLGEVDDPDLDAPEPPLLTPEQARWLELFDTLDAGGRNALVQIAERMVTGMNTPTVNAPRQAYRGEE